MSSRVGRTFAKLICKIKIYSVRLNASFGKDTYTPPTSLTTVTRAMNFSKQDIHCSKWWTREDRSCGHAFRILCCSLWVLDVFSFGNQWRWSINPGADLGVVRVVRSNPLNWRERRLTRALSDEKHLRSVLTNTTKHMIFVRLLQFVIMQ